MMYFHFYSMNKILYIFLMCLFFFVACKRTNTGTLSVKETSKLSQLSDRDDISVNDKYILTIESFSQATGEALGSPTDADMIAHLSTFYVQNQGALDKLAVIFDDYQKNMEDEERAIFVASLIQKPATKQLKSRAAEIEYRLRNYPTDLAQFRTMMQTIEMRR